MLYFPRVYSVIVNLLVRNRGVSMLELMEKRPRKAAKDSGSAKKPNRTGKPINVWVTDELHDAVEEFRSAQRVKPTMTDVIELAILEFLTREGFWKADE